MDLPTPRTRRHVLRGICVVGTSFTVAGCLGAGGDGDGDRGDGQSDGGTSEEEPTEDAMNENTDDARTAIDGGVGGDGELDLREANVVAVEVEPLDGGYRFDVTLHHDDEGEDGYANWWQVETLDGTRLGRRDLLHPHAEQPFTRSDTFEIADGVDCVVVRGHDRDHGYGGQVATVDLATGESRFLMQGNDRSSLGPAHCP